MTITIEINEKMAGSGNCSMSVRCHGVATAAEAQLVERVTNAILKDSEEYGKETGMKVGRTGYIKTTKIPGNG